ncbi:hypothetical protein, conserved [Leishmania tarentolae]|uniref:Uncharacterized protein n=1 Tax=Leishmania tarentolae TaxID=5689 RepID=A0A640KVZ5_LEITA|nr:hypothetical protein, conserved [Leishmania tarentolae]
MVTVVLLIPTNLDDDVCPLPPPPPSPPPPPPPTSTFVVTTGSEVAARLPSNVHSPPFWASASKTARPAHIHGHKDRHALAGRPTSNSMSTRTVCPYCGKGVRFDAMKVHLDCCEQHSPLNKTQQSSSATYPIRAATGKAASGLEYYHQLNKLSCLGHPTRSTSDSGRNPSSAPPVREDATVTQQFLHSSSSLTVDVSTSDPRAPISSLEYTSANSQRHRSLPSVANSNDCGGAASLPTTPLLLPPSIRVDLRSSSRETDVRSRVDGAGLQSPSGVQFYRLPQSTDPFPAFSSGVSKTMSSKQHGTAEHIASVSTSSHSGALHSPLCGTTGETESLHRHPANSICAAPLSTRTVTLSGVSAAADDSALPSTIAVLSSANSTASAVMSTKCAQATPMAVSSAASAASSVPSSRRPTPQLSSFAIRLRGSKESSCSVQKITERGSHRRSMRLHDNNAVGETQHATTNIHAASSLGSESTAMTQVKTSLLPLQRLVRQQQEQLSALLRAHGDLQRQVTVQHGAYNEMGQRSMSQAAEMEAALQKYTAQWRREQAVMQESLAALWDTVSDIQQCLPDNNRWPTKILAASRPAEESAYYSDIASFIQPDVAVASPLSASLLPRKNTPLPSTQASLSAFANGFMHPSASPSVCSRSVASAAAEPSGTGAGGLPYTMDVLQQRRWGSVEDQVVAMLHRKPTVVVHRSAWRQQ